MSFVYKSESAQTMDNAHTKGGGASHPIHSPGPAPSQLSTMAVFSRIVNKSCVCFQSSKFTVSLFSSYIG